MSDLHRRRELALIHVAKKQLALADESYRAILRRLAGVESAALLDDASRERVLAHFKALGWVYKPAKRAGPSTGSGRRQADGGQARKIRALWLALYHLGEVQDPAESAIAAFVRRQTSLEALQWLTPSEANRVIEALKSWCARAGFDEGKPYAAADVERWRKGNGRETPPGLAAKCNLIEAQWAKLIALGAMRTGANAKLETWLRRYGVAATWFLEPEDADRAIEALGAWIRKVKSKRADDQGA